MYQTRGSLKSNIIPFIYLVLLANTHSLSYSAMIELHVDLILLPVLLVLMRDL